MNHCNLKPEQDPSVELGNRLCISVDRRTFVKKTAKWTGLIILSASLGSLSSCARKETTPPPKVNVQRRPEKGAGDSSKPDLCVARDYDPARAAYKAIEALGGMGRFVKPGNTVVIKPNASFLKPVDSAANTNPLVVAEIVALCRAAGAREVIVVDHTLQGRAEACLKVNGIGEAARKSGARILAYDCGDSGHGVRVEIPRGFALDEVDIYPEVIRADVVISVPKAKHHSSTGVTLGMKNFIGVTTDMGFLHTRGIHGSIADINMLIKPDLCVIDASTVLLDNGPGGPGPVRRENKVIASHDIVAADSFACSLFGVKPSEIEHIVLANRAGVGEIEYERLKLVEA